MKQKEEDLVSLEQQSRAYQDWIVRRDFERRKHN